MQKDHFKVGRTFPPTGQGVGWMFAGIGGSLLFYFLVRMPYNFDATFQDGLFYSTFIGLPLTYFGLWFIFSTSNVYVHKLNENYLINKYGLFPFIFSRKIVLTDYDAAILKQTRQKYVVKQAIGGLMSINSPEFKESFFGLYFKVKGNWEEELILKGKGQEVIGFVEENLAGKGLRIFFGVVKKEYEMDFDKDKKCDTKLKIDEG